MSMPAVQNLYVPCMYLNDFLFTFIFHLIKYCSINFNLYVFFLF